MYDTVLKKDRKYMRCSPSLVIREMQVKISMDCHFIPTRMAKTEKPRASVLDGGQLGLPVTPGVSRVGKALRELSQHLLKLKMCLPRWSSSSLTREGFDSGSTVHRLSQTGNEYPSHGPFSSWLRTLRGS